MLYVQLIDNNYKELKINSTHAKRIKSLPLHHGDPFDYRLIAQAMSEDFTLMFA